MHTCVHEYRGFYLSRSTGSHSAQCSPPVCVRVCVCVCVRACVRAFIIFPFFPPPLSVRAPSPVCVYARVIVRDFILLAPAKRNIKELEVKRNIKELEVAIKTRIFCEPRSHPFSFVALFASLELLWKSLK